MFKYTLAYGLPEETLVVEAETEEEALTKMVEELVDADEDAGNPVKTDEENRKFVQDNWVKATE